MDINEVSLRHLANRPRTKKEIKDHLIKKGFEPIEIKEEIDYLLEHKYIDDSSYTEEYIRYGFSKNKGIGRIEMELYQKGVSKEDFSKGYYAYEDEYQIDIKEIERENCYNEADKIMSRAISIDQKTIAKLGRRLSSLGYQSGLVYEIIGKYMKEKNNDGSFE
ncbi:MAG: regulatory protein RecX [Anaerovoracaceae bacterium]